jgi:hypothetical protein
VVHPEWRKSITVFNAEMLPFQGEYTMLPQARPRAWQTPEAAQAAAKEPTPMEEELAPAVILIPAGTAAQPARAAAAAVEAARREFGYNRLDFKQENNLLQAIIKLLKEPMVILLLIAASIYFASGKVGDGIFLSFAIIFEISISLYQDNRSKNALEKLKAYTKPKCKVIREGALAEIATKSPTLTVVELPGEAI